MDLQTLQARIAPMFPGTMGVQLTSVAPDRVVATLLVTPGLCTAGDILHGGAYMAFADALGAIGTVVNLQAGQMTTTTDSSTKFIGGAKVNTVVTGEAVALHRGRTTQVWQTTIRNAEGKLCSVITQTQLVMGAKGG